MSDMILEINGVPYTGFTKATASKSMDNISGEFNFSVSALNDLTKFPIKNKSPCCILVNNKPFITGYVEKITISYDSTSHQINVSGRDKTCDIVDNTIGSELSFTAGITLQDIIKKVLTIYGLENSIGISSNTQIDPFTKEELGNISAQLGETAFTFLEKYAKKRQVLIMSDGGGNIVLARASKERIKTTLTSNSTLQSTILNAAIDYDDTKRFYKYVMLAQQNSTTSGIIDNLDNINHSNEKIVSMMATSYDKQIRNTRVYNLLQHDDSYNSQSDLQERAQWESNYRMATGFKYSVTVQGFSPINDPLLIWQPNMLVFISDDYSDIEDQLLLIKSVAFNYSVDGGSTTTLELIDKDGYSVDVLQGIKYRKKRQTGKKVTDSIVNDLSPYRGIK